MDVLQENLQVLISACPQPSTKTWWQPNMCHFTFYLNIKNNIWYISSFYYLSTWDYNHLTMNCRKVMFSVVCVSLSTVGPHYYHPTMNCRKVMFSVMCVCLFTAGLHVTTTMWPVKSTWTPPYSPSPSYPPQPMTGWKAGGWHSTVNWIIGRITRLCYNRTSFGGNCN